QRRGGAREAGTAGIGLGGDRAHRREVVTAGEDGLDGAVVRAVVGECALARGLEARGAVRVLERENALGGAQALADAVREQLPDQLRAGVSDLAGLLQTPAAVVREEALGGRRQMVGGGATLAGPPAPGRR